MKLRSLFSTMVLLFVANLLFAQKTYVPDDKFEQALINLGLDIGPLNDSIYTNSIKDLIILRVSNQYITDLTGIEDFVALEKLYCEGNNLTRLDLGANKNLKTLACSSNHFTTLDLSANKNLEQFWCQYSDLSELNVSGNVKLTKLYCSDNDISELDLSKNIELSELYCQNNKLSSIDLSSNGLLSLLSCSNNNLSELDVNANPLLTGLFFSENHIVNIPGIEKLTALERLSCANNLFTDIDLHANVKLIFLHCNNNSLSNLDLSHNVALETLYCSYNNLSDLDLSRNFSLKELEANNNKLTGLNIRNGNNSIMSVNVTHNPDLRCIQVDDFDVSGTRRSVWLKDKTASYAEDCSNYVSGMTYIPDDNFEQALIDMGYDSGELNDSVSSLYIRALTDLSIVGKGIQNLSGIEEFESLQSLDCSSNLLTTLDLRQNTKLTTLDCHGNKIASLFLSLDMTLQSLDCSSNKIVTLDLSFCPHLAFVNCSNNQITELNLKNGNNISLQTLDATGNPNLLCIQVDNANSAATYSNWHKSEQTSYSENCNIKKIMTYVPDDNFERVLIYLGIDTGSLNDSILTESIKNLKSLNVANKNITDLTGIEDFSSLETLICNDNQITEINLSGMANLHTLKCENNKITDLDVSSNSSLGSFNARNNQLTGLNLKNGNNKNMYMTVTNNPNLFCIQVDNPEESYKNQYWSKDLFPIYTEDCSKELPKNVYIPDDDFEKQLIALGYDLALDDSVSSIYIRGLKSLSIGGGIRDLTGIQEFKELTELRCGLAKLKSIDISQNTKLESLSCEGNEITDIKLNSNLKFLYCNDNEIASLDLSRNPNLEILNCRWNKISSLNVSSNPKLSSLFCTSNKIGSLDLSSNPQIRSLDCQLNPISELNLKNGNISGLVYLTTFETPNLRCIQVDDVDLAYKKSPNAWQKEAYCEYSKDCSYARMTYVPDDNFEQALIDLRYDSGNLDNYVATKSIDTIKVLNVAQKNISDLSGIEDFVSLKYFDCSNNSLDFRDFEPIYKLSHFSNFKSHFYNSPQAKIGTELLVEKKAGESIELNLGNYISGVSDKFQWYKNGTAISGATQSMLQMNNLQPTDGGDYHCDLTNSLVEGLSISSKIMTLRIKTASEVAKVPDSEYKALVALYNAMDGVHWTQNENWLDTINHVVNDWHGITVENGHVTQINLENTNTKGTIPSELGNLPELKRLQLSFAGLSGPISVELSKLSKLEYLDLSNNEFGTESINGMSDRERIIPDELDGLTRMNTFNFGGNKLQFNDVEAIFSWKIFNNFVEFIYYPQDSIGIATIENRFVGDDISFSIENYFSGTSDVYQWYKNGVSIPGATASILTLNKIQHSDEGNYTCKVTNPVASELTLYSRATTLHVTERPENTGVSLSEYNALVDFYNSENGINWGNNENWLDTTSHTVDDWDRITVENGHVTELDLSGLNLDGDISPFLSSFDSLTWLDLSNNNFGGQFSLLFEKSTLKKLVLSEKSTLGYLNIANNKFVFADLQPMVNKLNSVDDFIYAPQAFVGAPFDTAIYKGQSVSFTVKNYIPGEFDSYSWLKNGIPVTGGNGLTFTLQNAMLPDSGFYTCEITNSLFPELILHSDTIKISVLTPVGINEVRHDAVNIYPNPASKRVFIEADDKIVKLMVFNLAGMQVFEKNDFSSGWINLEEVNPGIYIFRILLENNEPVDKKVILRL